MRVLVIGGSGFIGRHVVRRLNRTPKCDVVGTFRTRPPGNDANSWLQVDLRDGAGLQRLFELARPDVVVHLAAIADVGTAERDQKRATEINVAATSVITRLSERQGAKQVFVSTEYVFGGERGRYREDEPSNPTTHYGRTKWEAELEVAKLSAAWSVLRTSIVYGWPEPGQRNFAPWLIESLRSGHGYNAPADVYRTPVFVDHLVEGIAKLVLEDHHGIYHVAGRDWVNMYDFASAIAGAFSLDTELVKPIERGLSGSREDDRERAATPKDRDLLGLDCARSMEALGLEYFGLAEGIAALCASAHRP